MAAIIFDLGVVQSSLITFLSTVFKRGSFRELSAAGKINVRPVPQSLSLERLNFKADYKACTSFWQQLQITGPKMTEKKSGFVFFFPLDFI